ncbi:hypothetical protein MNBD_GAMMA02-1639 [hydrothermal vent metagenome]|uniref:Ribosomal protein L7/L12 C-terminal domain-containing protein n=1 Tax=hydrothermal vent metagenome TaxID=652676 RepID=A0A3B0VNF7_9ZZZZ
MSEFQSIVSILMALIIGFVIGRSSKNKSDPRHCELTQEEQASLNSSTASQNPYDDVHWDVKGAIKSGHTIEAIKMYRQHHASSLKEAKDAVKAIARNL